MFDMLADNFRANLKRRRSELGITQTDLAERLRVSGPYVNQLENGEKSPTTETIERVAKALDCDALSLLLAPVAATAR